MTRTAAAWVGRVGALAAALGVGAVIGFSTCGSATAAPASSDPSARADADHTSAPARRATDHTSTPARRPSVANRDHAVAGNAPRPVAASRVAATAIRPVAAPKAVAVPATAVASNPAVTPSTDAAVQAAPAAVPWQASRRTAVARTRAVRGAGITLPWCDPRGRQITIYKGTHFAIPNSFGYFIKETVGTGTFTTNTVYDLTDVDQYDWNKFTGIAFTPLEPDRNSAMVGWRYNLRTQEFEIAPFYNVDKVRILPNELTEVISVPAGETFTFDVNYTGIALDYGGQHVYKAYPEGLTPNVWTAARVSGWFGGNEVAPRTVSYFINLN
ncbi:MAG: hypothetical protein NT146_11970 [Mycobacterium sp.]|nr:hypothetical protein [Mycobacterium sp.]